MYSVLEAFTKCRREKLKRLFSSIVKSHTPGTMGAKKRTQPYYTQEKLLGEIKLEPTQKKELKSIGQELEGTKH